MASLQEHGFLCPQSELVSNAREARRAARRIGFPVALKISSPDILHKTDAGGVKLGIQSEQDAAAGFKAILDSVAAKCPSARIEGVTVEKMYSRGQEIIIGLLNDRQFGPSIMFGLGGVWVELLQDTSFRVLPISRQDAEAMVDEIKGRKLLDGYRGSPAVSRPMIVDLLMKAAQMGMDLAPRLESVDLNPISVWGDEYRVLDAKILLRDKDRVLADSEPNIRYLDQFFNAKSVALIGASATPGKIGYCVLESLAKHEYRGKVFPINPHRDELMGIKCYSSLKALPERAECVVAAVALSLVPTVLQECAEVDVHNLIVVSGGGKELGGAGKQFEEDIAGLAKETGVRVIGPNCIGVFDGSSRLDTFFQVHDRMVRPVKGTVAVLTQSGTVGAVLLEKAERLGVSRFVSYGNRVDVDEADLLAYLADDHETQVIVCYIEGLSDGRKFLSAASQVARKKPVLVLKAGRSERGARASVSHTGFFGGSYALFEGAMRQAGLISFDSIEELFAGAKALALQRKSAGPRVSMISNGAGTMVQAMDLLDSNSLQMPTLSHETVAQLIDVYPPFYIVQNPVDVTGSATTQDYEKGIESLLLDEHIDIVMPWFVFQDTPLGEDIVEVLAKLNRAYSKPIICGAAGGLYTERMSRAIEEHGVPVYSTVREWVGGAKALAFAGAHVRGGTA